MNKDVYITRLARLSDWPTRVRNSKTKCRKTKIGLDVLQVTSKWSTSTNFQKKKSKVKVTGRKKTSNIWHHVYLQATDQAQADPAPTTN